MAENYWIKRERDHINKSIKDDKLIAKKITKLNKLIKDKLRGSTQFFCLFGVNCGKRID